MKVQFKVIDKQFTFLLIFCHLFHKTEDSSIVLHNGTSPSLPRSRFFSIVTRVIPKIVIPDHRHDLSAHQLFCTIYLKIACTIDCRDCILWLQVYVSRVESNDEIEEFFA